jgi:uncharacterized protein (DUF488 family)
MTTVKGFLTIGHGRRTLAEFNGLLKTYGVKCLVDVRSIPFSRFNPQYNRKALDENLSHQNISYMFMGDTLGGRPKDDASYDENHNINYQKLKTRPFFKSGMSKLRELSLKEEVTVLMCSESDPAQCHRCKLIGAELVKEGYDVMHIDKDGALKTHDEIRRRIKGEKQTRMFDE